MNTDTECVKTKAVWEYSIQRRKAMALEIREEQHLKNPGETAAFLRGLGLAEKEQEHLLVILLNTRNHIRGYSLITIGLVDRTQSHAREVFRCAILQGTTKIILAHNHPSGDPTPSARDIKVTRRLVKAGKIIGIEVMDHVVIGQPNTSGCDYLSFWEQKLL
jgi:DNA repair protein RadC